MTAGSWAGGLADPLSLGDAAIFRDLNGLSVVSEAPATAGRMNLWKARRVAGLIRRLASECHNEGTSPMHPYTVKIRFNGSVSYVTVNANSGGQAKQLVIAQYGGQVDVLSAQRA